ncbi:hypothetical protein DFS34DRAFT_627770 [Phlyctochytrium arcticum]|nr:hypothetical protein DFS34DRAFT_627770 [Phlyctochytrium arcticum]
MFKGLAKARENAKLQSRATQNSSAPPPPSAPRSTPSAFTNPVELAAKFGITPAEIDATRLTTLAPPAKAPEPDIGDGFDDFDLDLDLDDQFGDLFGQDITNDQPKVGSTEAAATHNSNVSFSPKPDNVPEKAHSDGGETHSPSQRELSRSTPQAPQTAKLNTVLSAPAIRAARPATPDFDLDLDLDDGFGDLFGQDIMNDQPKLGNTEVAATSHKSNVPLSAISDNLPRKSHSNEGETDSPSQRDISRRTHQAPRTAKLNTVPPAATITRTATSVPTLQTSQNPSRDQSHGPRTQFSTEKDVYHQPVFPSQHSPTTHSMKRGPTDYPLPPSKTSRTSRFSSPNLRSSSPSTSEPASTTPSVPRHTTTTIQRVHGRPTPPPPPHVPNSLASRLPGPAGKLPELTKEARAQMLSMRAHKHPLLLNPKHKRASVNHNSSTSQHSLPQLLTHQDDDFQCNAWSAMLYAFPSYDPSLNGISTFLRQPYGEKIPDITVLIKELRRSDVDGAAVLKDPSGEIQAAVHRQVFDTFGDAIAVGSVLQLSNISTFMPTGKAKYLNVTVANVACVYPANAEGSIILQKEDDARQDRTGAFVTPATPQQTINSVSKLSKPPMARQDRRPADNRTDIDPDDTPMIDMSKSQPGADEMQDVMQMLSAIPDIEFDDDIF